MKIRKVLSLVLIALLISGAAFGATPGRDLGHGRGDIMGNKGRYDFDPHKTFRLVRYVSASGQADADSATLSANAIVVWDVRSDDGVTVTTSVTSYDSTVAGIIVQDALTPVAIGNTAKVDQAQRNWTWLQTYGLSEVQMQGDGTSSAGDALAVGSDPGEACAFVASATASGANGNAGFFYDDGTAASTGIEVFVRCE